MQTPKRSCPACGYALGGEIPDDAELGKKKDADLPDERLPVYQGENVKADSLKNAPSSDDTDPRARAEFAAALRRRRRNS